MNIVKLIAENVKRLHAVEITPEGSLITIGGQNSAGKSSVLDSIAYALGGEKLVPSEPLRRGESEGKIVVDLGDFIVTRKFKRERGVDVPGASDAREYWGETKSTLMVTNRDGARYPSPQALLDKLYGRLTFDPLAFAREGETADGRKRQADTLRRLVGLDLEAFDRRRQDAAQQRATVKRSLAAKAMQLTTLPVHEGVPTEEVASGVVFAELQKAEEYRGLAEVAEREVARRESHLEAMKKDHERIGEKIIEAQRVLNDLKETERQMVSDREDRYLELDAARITADAARAVVPDIDSIHAKMKEVEATNQKVRANLAHAKVKQEVEDLTHTIEMCDNDIVAAEGAKLLAIAEAPFPVPGLGLNDEGVTFFDLPFNQAGSSEQVRVSVAIGVALNPTLRVLLIRNGNLLDKKSLAAVAEQAAAAGMQVWCEYVTEGAEGVSVFIEDGRVA